MTKLIAILKTEVRNIDDYLEVNFNDKDSKMSYDLWELIRRYEKEEDIEIRKYVNDEEFYLYNIHTTDSSLYVERYDSKMNDTNYEEIIQESKCRDITDETDIIELLLSTM